MSTIVENTNPVTVDIEPKYSVTTHSGAIVENKAPEYSVSVQRKEYKVVGDNIYIPRLYDDAPQWMKDLVNTVVDVKTAIAVGNLDDALEALRTLSDELEVAKNTYTNSIISSNDIDQRINTAIETLNSSLAAADATILNIAQTAVTPEEASAIAINTLSASLSASGEIGSFISNMNAAFADLDSATTQSINFMESAINAEFSANATAVNAIRTYVGIDGYGAKTGTGLLADVEILQKQNDGIIETVSGEWDVMLNAQDPEMAQLVVGAEPYSSWKALDVSGIDTRLAHIGDIYIKYSTTANGAKEYIASYKFIRTTVDTISPYATDADGFTWALIVDQAAQDAYEAALNAFDLADDKRRVFVNTPYAPYDIGDLWLVQAGASIIGTTQGGRVIQAGDLLRCTETKTKTGLYENNDWVPADNYRESMNAIQTDLNNWRTGTYAPFVSNIQTQVDKKAETFYLSSVPLGRVTQVNVPSNVELDKYVGDLWKNTYVGTVGGYLGNNTEYIYTKTQNGAKWNYGWTKMEVPDIVFDTIDTKKSIYSGNSVPVAIYPDVIEINDMWITGSNPVSGYDKESIYVWDGNSWEKPLKYTDDSAAIAIQTGLANGTIDVKLSQAYVGNTLLTDYISQEIDKEVVVYSGTSADKNALTGMKVNDIFIEKTTATGSSGIVVDVVNTYKYSGTTWVQIGNNSNLTALADLADGKRTIFSNDTSMPINPKVRDMWIPANTYLTYTKGEIYLYNGTSWVVATKYSADIAALTSNVQSQIDSKVDTYYQAAVPYANATNVARKKEAGDYWYCTSTANGYVKGKMYKYVETPNGSNWNYTWTETADVTKYAFDKADSKAAIYTTAAKPNTYNIRDMLIVINDNDVGTYSSGVVLTATATRTSGVFTASEWTKQINDTEDLDNFVSSTYTPTINSLKTQVDAKIEYWFQTTDPKISWTTPEERIKHNGDVWYNTSTKISQYYSSSTNSWNLISDKDALNAIAAAEAARQLADSKVEVRYGTAAERDATSSAWTAAEKTSNIGDIWIISDAGADQHKQFRWNGSGWFDVRDKKIIANAEAITQLGVDISNEAGLRAAGDTTVTNTVKAYADSVGAGVESKWAYDSIVNIGGIYKKSGFGLTTNYTSGSGTQSDPYVSEFWIDASRLKFTNSNMTGQVAPFTIDATGATPEITFNGKVSFTNVKGYEDDVVSKIKQGKNLIYEDWSTGTGSTAKYIINGLVSENSRVIGDNHLGNRVPLWVCIPDSASDADGGWNTTSFGIDKNKSYRFSVFVKTNTSNGTTYLGCGRNTVTDLNTSTVNANPYFWFGDLPVQNRWYLIVGYVHPVGQTGITSQGGIYDCTTGAKVAGTTDFNWSSSTLNSLHRCYHYYNTDVNTRQYMWNPRVDLVDGDEPSILDMIGISDVSSSINANNDVFAQKLGYADYAAMVAAASSGQTIINGGYIGTNLVKSSSILANSVSADRLMAGTNNSTVWTGGGLVSADFNGNTYGNIGSPTAGFRLSSNAVGTSADPNIYGAYIKGGSIEGVNIDAFDMLVKADGYPLNTGRISYAGLNGSIYMPGYGTGFNERRVCSKTTSIVKLEGWHRGATNYLVANLYYRINGGNWINIASKTAQAYGYQEAFYIYFSELFNMSSCPVDSYVEFLLNGNGDYVNSSPVLISIYNN